MFFSFFQRKKIFAAEFIKCVFSLLTKRITDKKAVEEELTAIKNLPSLAITDAQRDKFAAHWYSILETHIGKEQPKGRIPSEILREQILRHCHPERAEGNFALIFLPSSRREMRLLEQFAEAALKRVSELMDQGAYMALLHDLETDEQFRVIIHNGALSWSKFERRTAKLRLPDQVGTLKEVLKRLFQILIAQAVDTIGEMRLELILKETYHEFHGGLDFLEDAPRVLLVIPEEFLSEERIGLLQKPELEEELRRKSRQFEAKLVELKGEKSKLGTLSREELEQKISERTAELVSTLENLKANRGKLEEAKAQDEAFLESIGEGLVAIDREWNVVLWNKAASTLSGWTKEKALGNPLRNFVKFVHERDRTEHIEFIEEAMLFGEPRRVETDMALLTKDGMEIAVSTVASPVSDQNRKVTSAVIIFRDISKERELERAREEFASLATHELRTPVAAIKGYATLLLEGQGGALTEPQKKLAGQIREANERLLALVNAMLNVARIELGTLAIKPEPTYIPEIADSVLTDLYPQIKANTLQVEKEYDKALPSVSVDPKLTHAIFQNLLSNAVKYTPAGGTIKVTIEKQKFDVLIGVSDTGCGIPKSQQSKVFTKLFRGDNVRQMGTEGTGLGLYIVKSVVEQSGGKIWFESPARQAGIAGGKENKGTTFFVTIPLAGMQKREGAKGLT